MAALYRQAPIDGKGIGMLATDDISPGTLILQERPLVMIPIASSMLYLSSHEKLILAQLGKLTQEQKASYLALHNAIPLDKLKPFQGIFATNSFGLGEEDNKAGSAVFAIASRFNHSCSPNANFV